MAATSTRIVKQKVQAAVLLLSLYVPCTSALAPNYDTTEFATKLIILHTQGTTNNKGSKTPPAFYSTNDKLCRVTKGWRNYFNTLQRPFLTLHRLSGNPQQCQNEVVTVTPSLSSHARTYAFCTYRYVAISISNFLSAISFVVPKNISYWKALVY